MQFSVKFHLAGGGPVVSTRVEAVSEVALYERIASAPWWIERIALPDGTLAKPAHVEMLNLNGARVEIHEVHA